MSNKAQGRKGWGWGRRQGSRADPPRVPTSLRGLTGLQPQAATSPSWWVFKGCVPEGWKPSSDLAFICPSGPFFHAQGFSVLPLPFHEHASCSWFTLCSTCQICWLFSPRVFLPSGYRLLLGFLYRQDLMPMPPRETAGAGCADTLRPSPHCDSNNPVGRLESLFHVPATIYSQFSHLQSLLEQPWKDLMSTLFKKQVFPS